MKKYKYNICKKCGGPLLLEYPTGCGTVYLMKQNGDPKSRHLRRIIYGIEDKTPKIYCAVCGAVYRKRKEA